MNLMKAGSSRFRSLTGPPVCFVCSRLKLVGHLFQPGWLVATKTQEFGVDVIIAQTSTIMVWSTMQAAWHAVLLTRLSGA